MNQTNGAQHRRFEWATIGLTLAAIGALLVPMHQDETLKTLFNAGHVPAFALLSMLWLEYAAQRGRTAFKRALLIGGIALVLALSTEALQAFVPGRYPDVGDVARNLLGLAVGLLAHWRWPQALRLLLGQ